MALRAGAGVGRGTEAEAAAAMVPVPGDRLPAPAPAAGERRPARVSPAAGAAAAGAGPRGRREALWVVAPDLAAARRRRREFPDGGDRARARGRVAGCWKAGRSRGTGRDRRQAADAGRGARRRTRRRRCWRAPGNSRSRWRCRGANEAWLRALTEAPARLVLWQPTHERLTSAATEDLDLPAFFAAFTLRCRSRGCLRACSGGRRGVRPKVLDAAMLTAEGRVEIFRYARRYVLDRFYTKSLRCRGCVHDGGCAGCTSIYVRAPRVRGDAADHGVTGKARRSDSANGAPMSWAPSPRKRASCDRLAAGEAVQTGVGRRNGCRCRFGVR
jgi:hypothetical protein